MLSHPSASQPLDRPGWRPADSDDASTIIARKRQSDLADTLERARSLLAEGGLFISKTPCIGDMNPLLGYGALPVMRALRLAPYSAVFDAAELSERVAAAGFQILAIESHATKGKDRRPYIVARKS